MKRSKFSLSHYKLFTCDMGELVPIGLTEVLPGDSIQHSTSLLLRVSPLLAPVMHPVTVRVHHFLIPFRLLWSSWEDFITGGPDGMDASTPPMYTNTSVGAGSILDYMGVPPGVAGLDFSALPARAYNTVFNEYYRDEDLVAERSLSDSTVAKVAWEKDYFTSARVTPQKGPEVTIPLGTRAPVRGIGAHDQTFGAGGNFYETDGAGTVSYASGKTINPAGASTAFTVEQDPDNAGFPNIWADLSEASAATVDEFRRAMAIQRYQEARSRYGSRYTEYLAYLGVRSSDARLQRPEYLGGGKQTISFSEVLQTGPDAADDGVATLRGHGISALRSRTYRKFIEEHGYVLSLMSVRPRSMYVNGMHRMWNRMTKEDFWQKELQHIGQQEVKKQEVYAQGTTADLETFGYQDRYAEYRHMPSTIAGEFRNTLNYWHLGRIFSSMPTLNSSFVTCEPSKRINAVQTNDVLWCMASHSIQARRLVDKSAGGKIL